MGTFLTSGSASRVTVMLARTSLALTSLGLTPDCLTLWETLCFGTVLLALTTSVGDTDSAALAPINTAADAISATVRAVSRPVRRVNLRFITFI